MILRKHSSKTFAELKEERFMLGNIQATFHSPVKIIIHPAGE